MNAPIMSDRLEARVTRAARGLHEHLVQTIRELVQIPSENTPPTGAELECQRYVHRRLEGLGLKSELYELADVPGLTEHPVFRHQREYRNRPNVEACWPGAGGGRSLLLSGHIDTVPEGSEAWTRDPFGGEVEGNRLYGRGSNDMKGGIAAALVAVEALKEAGVKLRGDLLVETIVDEEFGGVNGTLAGRLRGHNADAAIICEPSQQMLCPAQTGGRIVHITLRSGAEGILYEGEAQARVVDQLHYLLGEIKAFERKRSEAPVHALYRDCAEPTPAWVTKIHAGGWGTEEPITIPTTCKIELYWQQMPGEELAAIEGEFFDWFDAAIAARPDLFAIRPELEFPIVWLPGSAIDERRDLVTELGETFEQVTGAKPLVRGIGGPCDMFVFHQHFHTPALLFGPRGGNTHAPDEWVELDSAQATVETLAQFICRWCGIDA
ncbi:MAG: M20/M25/M40 family metallo-hydrolase [Blastocatellia bacterium]